MNLPFKPDSFDFAISIAVIHHLSTNTRRLRCMQEIFKVIKPGGSVMICVWAM